MWSVDLGELPGPRVALAVMVELDHPGSVGPFVYDCAYAGGLFTLMHSCLAAWIEWALLRRALRRRIGLVYRERSSMYTQGPALTLTYGVPGLSPPRLEVRALFLQREGWALRGLSG